MDPGNIAAYANLARSHARLGDKEAARRAHARVKQLRQYHDDLRAALQRAGSRPNDSEAYLRLAELYERGGGYLGAAAAYERALQLNPRNAEGWARLADVYILRRAFVQTTAKS